MTTPKASLYHSTNDSSSTLRPRNTRLISYLDDEVEAPSPVHGTTSSSSSSPPLFERGLSPSVSRNRSRDHGVNATGSGTASRKVSEDRNRSPANDVWSSWTSIATSLLGGESSTSAKGKGRASQVHPKWMKQDRAYASSPATPHWGPKAAGLDNAVSSSLDDRQAFVQAKKREALLLGSGEEARDASGRYKRRDSDADLQVPSREALDGDALVYVHKIKREDTLPGVMLKYGCQPDVFRKVNRFWPNDNIQVRNHVFLPVEACTIRGKKVDGPHAGPDLLGAAIEDLAKTTRPEKGALKRMETCNPPRTPEEMPFPATEPFPTYTSAADNPDLKHDSWVTVPNFPEPIAILRIPRSSLGYFPRARRKSLTKTMYSDASPRSSFEGLRHPPSHAAQMSLSQFQATSPARRPGLSPHQIPPSLSRKRSSSTATTSSAAAAQPSWSSVLTGPGGVGTLRGLRTEPSRPGPAEDSLNRTFKTYFPDLAITDPQHALEAARALAPPRTASYRASPRASIDSVRSMRSNSSGLGDLAVGVEGWVRKMAGGKRGKNGPGTGAGGAIGTGMEDLIELEMTPSEDTSTNEEGENVLTPTLSGAPMTGLPGIIGGSSASASASAGTGGGRRNIEIAERETEAGVVSNSQSSTSPTTTFATTPWPPNSTNVHSTPQSEQDMLDERFPVRGRVRTAYEKAK